MKKCLNKSMCILTFVVILSMFFMTGCKNDDNEKTGSGYSAYPVKSNVIDDRQYYTGGEVRFPETLWQTPKSVEYPEIDHETIKAYFIDSVQETKVFVYVGLPDGASEDNPVPGIVLIHGGGGTAFYEWVEFWTKRGYAAIAMDTDGHMPTADSQMNNNIHAASVYKSGPANAGLTDGKRQIEEQWAYHAVSAVIASNSFLRSLPEVDNERIGVTGISYGGFLTCLAAGYDDRFVFACPVYGSLSQKGTAGFWGEIYRTNPRSAELWDDIGILFNCRTPILFINGSNDPHFSVDAISRCAVTAMYGSMCVKYKFGHSHIEGAKQVNELYAFADGIVLNSNGLVQPLSLIKNESGYKLRAAAPADIKMTSAVIYSTKSETLNGETSWKVEYEQVVNGVTSFTPAVGTTFCFINIVDDRGLEISSELVQVD